MYSNYLNDDSIAKINTIVAGFRRLHLFNSYEIGSFVYDEQLGVHGIGIRKNGTPCNLFLFYPMPGGCGEIESIAIYGQCLHEHYKAIESSMSIFGLPVDSIQNDFGLEPFIDVHLKKY